MVYGLGSNIWRQTIRSILTRVGAVSRYKTVSPVVWGRFAKRRRGHQAFYEFKKCLAFCVESKTLYLDMWSAYLSDNGGTLSGGYIPFKFEVHSNTSVLRMKFEVLASSKRTMPES